MFIHNNLITYQMYNIIEYLIALILISLSPSLPLPPHSLLFPVPFSIFLFSFCPSLFFLHSLVPSLSPHRLRSDGSNLIQDRRYHLSSFKQCFVGRELVDWLLARGEASSRPEATDLGRRLLEAGVFRHGKPTNNLTLKTEMVGFISAKLSNLFVLNLTSKGPS